MKTFKKVIIGLLIVVVGGFAIACIAGACMSGQMHVERSSSIDAPAEKIFPLIADMHNWPLWSPWHKIDPQMKVEYFGAASGMGAGYSWTSNHGNVGNGKLTTIGYEENKKLDIEMDFMENGKGKGSFTLVPEGNSTKVIWTMDSNMRENKFPFNLIGPLFKSMAEGMIAKDFDSGLAGIKTEAEKL